MFVREKTIRGYTYLYLVENIREDGRTRQRIIKNLGRKDAVLASGELDRLAASAGRHAERTMVLDAIENGAPDFFPLRIGGPLLFRPDFLRTYLTEARKLNQRIKFHNARCPKNQVELLPTGPYGVK